jgi:hypothetical protein
MNPWIEHVRKEATRLKISYSVAISDPRVKASYQKKPNPAM